MLQPRVLKPSVVLCFRLLASAVACLKVQLLTYLERGSLYRYIKERSAYPGNWMDVCRQHLGITPKTVNRYIQFFELVGTYLHLIICEIPFETIMFCRNEIRDVLKRDNDLAASFTAPLPEVQIGDNICFREGCLPTNEGMAAGA